MNLEAEQLWASIRNENCEECPLHEEAQTVCLVGDGPVASAKFVVIGEAPGYREDDVAKPFQGRSGKYLDSALEKQGLSRKDAFISNAVKCRPPENRTPTRAELKACRHYLDDELQATGQAPILLLGNSALTVIRPQASGIMKYRGQFHEYQGRQVMASVHPAAVLRNPKFEQMFNSDIATFARLVKGEDAPAGLTRTFLVNSKKALVKACQAILTTNALAYDLETNGFDEFADDAAIATIAVAVKPGVVFVVPIHHSQAFWKDPSRVLEILGRALMFTNAKRIAHNAKFDDRWLNRFGIPIHADFDTMIAAHLLDENRFKGLKVLAPMLLGVNPWADVDLSDGGAMTAGLENLARYNAKDADYTLRLYWLFRQELLRKENRRTRRIFTNIMMPASAMLTDVEQVGLWLDMDRLNERRIQVRKNIGKMNRKLTKLAGYEANWNSTQQLARILFDEMKLPLIEVTAKGNASTREAVLLQLRHDYPIADNILEYRKWFKYDSTYFASWLEKVHGGRMHANYKLTGTVTGRISSGKEEGDKSRGLNAQQIPRDQFLRGVIGAPPGWKFVEADFSQIELRIVAHYSQDPTMMRVYNEDGDIHMETATGLTNKPASAVTKEERKKAKGVNFGFVFGMGWSKFIEYARDSYDLVVTPDESRLYRKRFFQKFSKIQAWHERQRKLVRQYHKVTSLIGRTRNLPDVLSEDEGVRSEAERQAINSPVQGLASDMMLLSLNTLHAMFDPEEVRIVGTVHDSGLFEIREDCVDKWVPIIREVMENLPLEKLFGAELSVPIKVDILVGTHWGEGEPA